MEKFGAAAFMTASVLLLAFGAACWRADEVVWNATEVVLRFPLHPLVFIYGSDDSFRLTEIRGPYGSLAGLAAALFGVVFALVAGVSWLRRPHGSAPVPKSDDSSS